MMEDDFSNEKQLSIKQIINHAAESMKPETLRFFATQLLVGNKPSKARRWNAQDKVTLLHCTTRAPKLIDHYVLFLYDRPQGVSPNVNMSTGFDNYIFSIFKDRVAKMDDMEKCML